MASKCRSLVCLGITRCTNRPITQFNFGHHNALPLLEPGKSCVSFAGQKRYFFIKNILVNQLMQTSYGKMLKDQVGDDVEQTMKELSSSDEKRYDYNRETLRRQEDTGSEVVLQGITTERERGLKPTIEPIVSIRRKTIALESLIAPELEKPQTVLGSRFEIKPILNFQYFPEYVTRKWSLILQKEDLRVKQLINLMEKADIPQVIFVQTLAKFSFVPLKYVFFNCRPLSTFTPEQVEYSLRSHFSLEQVYHPNLELEIKSITYVLMKFE